MKFYSPLRYPGGKNRLSGFIAKICIDNAIDGHYIEPYAGGASVALFLLIEKIVSKITINDFDKAIYAFWYSILNHTDEFCNLIETTEINITNWKIMKKINFNKQNEDILNLGFSTFFLNRTNISGIINAGVIGGLNQNGKYKIDCRFNKKNLIEKIRLIASYKEKIELYNIDALDLIKKISNESNNSQTIFYFDPPYYLKGACLYMSHYKNEQHVEVSNAIRTIQNINWIVSYDDVPNIESVYNWVPLECQEKYSFNHSAHKAKIGKEILFFSKNLFYSPEYLPT